MATFNKYQDFVEQIGLEVHNLNTDTLKVALFNTTHTPAATDTSYASLSNEVANGNGYVTGGEDSTNVWAEAGGVAKLTGTDITWTAVTSTIDNIRYAVLYNSTAAGTNLIGYWDYGAAGVTLQVGESLTVDFDPTNGILQIT